MTCKPAPTSLRVATVNFYVGNRQKQADKRLIQKIDADVVGLQEGQNIGGLANYAKKVGAKNKSRGAREVPVLVRFKRVTVRKFWQRKETPDLGTKVAHDRWTTVVRFEKDGHRFALLNTHFNAAITDASGRAMTALPRVKAYREHMKALLDLARKQREAGWTPIVTGDFNYRPRGVLARAKTSALWFWSPQRSFPRAGLTYRFKGLDGIAYDSSALKQVGGLQVRKPTGSDHDFLFLDLKTT